LDRIEGWDELKVIPNKRDSFTLPLLWSDVANVATETRFTVIVSLGDVTKSESVLLKALDYIPPELVISTISNNREKLTTVYGDVNWNELDPDRIIVDWGDGETSEGLSFPFDHKYDSWGNYSISIEAHSKEGAVGTYAEMYLCTEPPPQPPVIRKVIFNPVMPKQYTIEMEVEVDWGDYKKGRVKVDWGDGDKDNSSRLSFKHTYPRKMDFYTMTITAISSEDNVESKPVKYGLLVMSFLIMISRIG
jgi:hypothetical protein